MAESTRRSTTSASPLTILGAGPAGSAAALAALQLGSRVCLVERSRFPRHKVCGEFLSPEVADVLDSLGVARQLWDRKPARVDRMILHLRGSEKIARLPEPAWGFSRFALDAMLFSAAMERGATREEEARSEPTVLATGRSGAAPKGDRLFGFKAHFRGPVDSAVELSFFDGCYVGLNSVEDGITNVCGLGPENVLRRFGFHVDEMLNSERQLRARLGPLTRVMEWMFTGPLVFGNQLHSAPQCYLAGDALSFVDPFTGSGIFTALATGRLAGIHAATNVSPAEHTRRCGRALSRPFEISSALRRLVRSRYSSGLLWAVPGDLLFWATRPRVSALLRSTK